MQYAWCKPAKSVSTKNIKIHFKDFLLLHNTKLG